MACAMKASSLQQQCLVASPWQRSALRSAAAATQLPVRPQQQHRRRLAQQPPCAALMEVAQLAGEAGRAYDGSVWVTAASSVALGKCSWRQLWRCLLDAVLPPGL